MAATWAAGEALVRDAPGHWNAIVARGEGEVLWAHDADVQQLAASTIKIAVLIAVFRAIDAGRLQLTIPACCKPATKSAAAAYCASCTPDYH